MEMHEKTRFYDKPLVELIEPNWEKLIYLLISVAAVVSRFWDLGARAMSHDESLHALYSYYLYNGTGYTHTPMMHGPFLFHANALVYFLFGDSDYSARIVPALFGVFLVLSPILLRRWLGRTGAILTSLFLLISPSVLYYSRYIRNDVYIAVWTIVLIAALFHFLRDHRPSWFYLGAVVLMLSLTTKENAYIFGYIGLVFIIEAYLWERVKARNQLWLYVGGGVLTVLLMVLGSFMGRPPAEGVEAAEAAGGAMELLTAIVVVISGTIPAVLLSALIIPSRYPRRSSVEKAIRSLPWQTWLVAILVMFIIYALLFTTFFTNPAGLVTGIGGSISYWLAQQDVQRGGQPWYYYLLLLPMYEFVPLLFSLVAMLYYLVKGVWDKANVRRAEKAEASDASQDMDPVSDEGSSTTIEPAAKGSDQILFVAYDPWPGTYTFWEGKRLSVLSVRSHPQCRGEGSTGSVIPFQDGIAVVTGQGILELLELQLEGRKTMSAALFARGQRDLVGSRLET
ncbi:flippase activity-associated protein Agl23 [Chloroflexota bacterium]